MGFRRMRPGEAYGSRQKRASRCEYFTLFIHASFRFLTILPDVIHSMRVIDAIYDKAGLPRRP